MKDLNKEPLIQQTEFAVSQTWLEAPAVTPQEQAARLARKVRFRKTAMIVAGVVFVGIASVLLLMKLLVKAPAEIAEVVVPTPTPTESPVLTPLVARILEAKTRAQAIDIREADLALPQVEFDLWLDEPKKP